MVTLAVVAILMVIAVPSFSEFLRNNELRSVANGFYGAMLTARSEAIARNKNVYVVPYSGNDWGGGWKIFVDVNLNGDFDNGDLVINQNNDISSNISVSGVGPAIGDVKPYVMYDGSGFSKQKTGAFLAGTLSIKRVDTSSLAQVRRLKIASSGKVRICTPASTTDASCLASGEDQ